MSLSRCNPLVYRFGGFVAQVWVPGDAERFVAAIRKETKKRFVDWHSGAGYVIIRCIGNSTAVYNAVLHLAPDFNVEVV